MIFFLFGITFYNKIKIIKHTCLNWNLHTKQVSLKISRAVGILNHLKHYLPQKTLQTIYHALLTTHLKYQLLSWGYNNTDIPKLQEKSIRKISGSHFLAYTKPLFKQMKILPVPDLHSLVQMKMLCTFFHNYFPGYFIHTFSIHTIKTIATILETEEPRNTFM
jgi:hypothetical protein